MENSQSVNPHRSASSLNLRSETRSIYRRSSENVDSSSPECSPILALFSASAQSSLRCSLLDTSMTDRGAGHAGFELSGSVL